MVSIWKFFLSYRQFTWLLIAASVAAGVVAVIGTPKESAPEVEVPVGVVTTILPGASAEDVEKLVTARIENEIAGVENLDSLTSSSGNGVSSITAEFSANADLDKAIDSLKEAVDRAKPTLPEDAEEPVVSRINFSEQPVIIISIPSDLPPREVTALAETLKDELSVLSGVSRVDVSGTREREISVVVRKEALSQYELSIQDVTSSIRNAQASLPVGSLTIGNTEYALAFEGSVETAEEVSRIPVAMRGESIIYLGDIATISDGLEKAVSLSRVSVEGTPGQNALTLSVYKKSGGDITAVSRTIKERLDELTPTLLQGVPPLVTYDAGEDVEKDLTELTRTGLETVALVMILLFLTIGWREAIVAGLSIPLSFMIAFVGIYASGNTINFVSLFSLILAIGILVDSGIVVAEAIHTRYTKLKDATKAALETLEEYSTPLIAGTMVTIMVFLPLFFLSGVTGQFIASIPFTIIFVLLASILVALGFVPLLAILFTRFGNSTEGRLAKAQERLTHTIQEWYRVRLTRFLDTTKWHRPFLLTISASFILIFFLPASGLLKTIFFPSGDSTLLIVEIETLKGTPLLETDIAIRQAEEFLYEHEAIESFVTSVGGGSTFLSGGTGENLGNITINLKEREHRDVSSFEVEEDLRASFSSISNINFSITSEQGGPPTGAPIVVKLYGNNLNDLERAATLVEQELRRMEGTKDISSTLKDNGTEVVLTILRDRAAELGISPIVIADTLRTAITGNAVTSIETGTEDIDIRVRLNLNPDFRDPAEASIATLDDVRQIPINTMEGTVLLGSLVTESVEQGRASIQREDRERTASVSSYVDPGANAIAIAGELEKKIPELGLPEGIRVSFGGEDEEVNRSFAEMGLALIAGLILMLAVLVLEFNSFRLAGYILIIVPLTLIGVFVGLTIFGQPLSFPSMLGVIALAGVVVNHAIILVDAMIHVRKQHPSLPLKELIVDASVTRLRPIILTTLSTAVGMIPLMAVSALWAPLATAVMFGMLFSLVLTLVTTPLLCYRFPGSALRQK